MLTSSRALLRIARRNIGRNRWRSALVVALVLLPVAAMVGGVTFLRTTTPTREQVLEQQFGQADAFVYATSSGGHASIEQLRSLVPPGTVVEPATRSTADVVLPGRRLKVQTRAFDPNGLAAGILRLTDGRYPAADDEIAISASLARLAGTSFGGSIELTDSGPLRIVGLVEDPLRISSRVALRPAQLATGEAAAGGDLTWLVALPAGNAMPELGPDFGVQSRTEWGGGQGEMTLGMLVLGSLVLIETVLVASAAFAVSIRRRQRELAIMAAAGAQPRHMAGTVIGEGLVLGGLGSLLGALLGVGVVVALSPWLDQLTDHRNPPPVIDLPAITVAVLAGLIAAVLAAAIPAWSAARLPVLLALAGRRPATSSARWTLLLGLALIGLAGFLVSTGAANLLSRVPGSSGDLMLMGGAIVGVLGCGACSPWLVERLELLGRRLPLPARIAFRDTARARSRSAPIVTAMLSGLAATVAISAFVASSDAESDARWQPWARPDQIVVLGDEASYVGPKVADELGAIGASAMPWPASANGADFAQLFYSTNGSSAPVIESRASPVDQTRPSEFTSENPCQDCATVDRLTIGGGSLLTTLGAESATDALESGAVVLIARPALTVRQVTIALWSYRFHGEWSEQVLLSQEVVPALSVDIGVDPLLGAIPGAVLPPKLAASLNLTPQDDGGQYFIRLAHPVTEADLFRAAAALADYPDTYANAALGPEHPGDAARMVLIVLSLLLALTVTAIAVALAEAESRPDQRTLLAIGADPGIRRRIAAARAAVLASVGALLALPAGLLPVWGLFTSRNMAVVAPLPELIAILLVMPAAAVVGAIVLSRPLPRWSALRDVSTA